MWQELLDDGHIEIVQDKIKEHNTSLVKSNDLEKEKQKTIIESTKVGSKKYISKPKNIKDLKYNSSKKRDIGQEIKDLEISKETIDGIIPQVEVSHLEKTTSESKKLNNLIDEEKSKEIEKEKDKSTDEDKVTNPEQNNAEEYYQRQLGLLSTSGDDFAYGDTKRDLPVDAVMGIALGVIGNKQANDAKIPLRTEEVSEGLRNYAAELAKRSKEGLPVEIEAALKNQLADAYQGGLENIVRASEGNSATVLGNLGSLEQAKSKGLVAVQVADYQAKEKAFRDYGAVIMEINQFEIDREIANHGILYNEAKTDQLAGKALATTGMSKLIEGIKYDKENGPGSPNDMYRSLLMQKMFGFDPKKKDDGTGEAGTQSAFNIKKGLLNDSKAQMEEDYKRFQSLNPEQKKAMNLVFSETTDNKTTSKAMDYLQQNPDEDLSNFSMENIDQAIKKDDYSYLTTDKRGLDTRPVPKPQAQGISFNPQLPTAPIMDESVKQIEENDISNRFDLLEDYYNTPQ